MTTFVLRVVAAAGISLIISCGGGDGDGGSGPNPPSPAAVASVTVSPSSATILVGATTTLVATPLDANNNPLTGRAVTWASSDQAVATVSTSGVVTGIAVGGVTITATSEGRTGSAQVTVIVPPVASVSVSPAAASVVVGHTATLTATLRDAANNVLTDRTIAWTSANSALATVSPAGVVTAVSVGGPVAITATSEGQSGSAQVTVLEHVASVTLSGSPRDKVGDSYAYTATARATNGAVLYRNISWGVADPTVATMTPYGELTPLKAGTVVIVVRIDGDDWVAPVLAYDWESFGSGNVFGDFLPADLQITNQLGISEYPSLAMGCSLGFFVILVDTDYFITEDGQVAYAFDDQEAETATWLEVDDWSALGHPGPQAATYAFSNRMAQARKFWFAFMEFNSDVRATMFRVTGLAPRLPAFATCPAAGPAAVPLAAGAMVSAARPLVQRPTALAAEQALRAEVRAAAGRTPTLRRIVPAPTTFEARLRALSPH